MLITFIGSGSFIDRENKNQGYKTVRYQFPDGTLTDKVSYVGASLIDYVNPDKVVVAGTSGSMWDELHPDADSDDRIRLMGLAEKSLITRTELDKLESLLNTQTNIEYKLVLLPASASDEDQITFFSLLTEQVEYGSNLTIDITHGFRFQPMLALVCAQFLQHIKKVQIEELYYAQLNYDDTPSKIQSLKQILEISRWVNALDQYDYSGDLSVFGDLLSRQDWKESQVNQLKQAAFLERVNNVSAASNKLLPLLKSDWTSPISALFEEEFKSRINWSKQQGRGLKECQLARQYLERKDYLRAATFAFEGLISKYLLEHGMDEHKHKNRTEASNKLKEKFGDDFNHLNLIRNNLAHGHQHHSKFVNSLVSTQETLDAKLHHIFKKLEL